MQIKIKGTTFNQGDYVVADILNDYSTAEESDDKYQLTVTGRLFINKDGVIYICQNEVDGKQCDYSDRYNYEFSWVVYVDKNGDLLSDDTVDVRLASLDEVVDHLKKISYYPEVVKN